MFLSLLFVILYLYSRKYGLFSNMETEIQTHQRFRYVLRSARRIYVKVQNMWVPFCIVQRFCEVKCHYTLISFYPTTITDKISTSLKDK